jgi:hypothetical protein
LALPGIKLWFLGHQAHSLVTVLTELSQFSVPSKSIIPNTKHPTATKIISVLQIVRVVLIHSLPCLRTGILVAQTAIFLWTLDTEFIALGTEENKCKIINSECVLTRLYFDKLHLKFPLHLSDIYVYSCNRPPDRIATVTQ